MTAIKPPYWGKPRGNVAERHVRESMRRASEVNPHGHNPQASNYRERPYHLKAGIVPTKGQPYPTPPEYKL